MKTTCYGYARTPKDLLKVMDVMLRNGIAITGTTDSGMVMPSPPNRFHVFGVAEDATHVAAATKEDGRVCDGG